MLDSLIKNMLRLVVGMFLHPGLNSHCGILCYKIVFLFLRIFLESVSLLLFFPRVKDTANTSTLPAKLFSQIILNLTQYDQSLG